MNTFLTQEIVRHIMANFLIIPSNNVKQNPMQSLFNKNYLLPEKLVFELDKGHNSYNKIYGCQLALGEQEVVVLFGNCSIEEETTEYCLIVQVKGTPIYGLYLFEDLQNKSETNAQIFCSLDGKEWMICSTYLQATFLAGMEQLKENRLSWFKATNYKDQYQSMLSFIRFYNEGLNNEG